MRNEELLKKFMQQFEEMKKQFDVLHNVLHPFFMSDVKHLGKIECTLQEILKKINGTKTKGKDSDHE